MRIRRSIEAVSQQVATIAHTSNLFCNEPAIALAEKLLALLGVDGRVFFANSGTEANEAAYKLVRRHAGPGRTYVVAADRSFHGRTMGSLALTGKASIREPFGPFGADVRLRAVRRRRRARPPLSPSKPPRCSSSRCSARAALSRHRTGYLRAARAVCDATGAALVLDEIQSGIGRTGSWFLHQAEGVAPDVLTLAKGIGGGLPIGACIGIGEYGDVFGKGEHGSTFGGNPVACAAALAVISTRSSATACSTTSPRSATISPTGLARRHASGTARRPGQGSVARARADRPDRAGGRKGEPRRRFLGQRGAAGRDQDRAAAGAVGRRGRSVHRCAPGDPRRPHPVMPS